MSTRESALAAPPVQPIASASWWARHQRTLAPWLFLAPAMLAFLLYVIAPIFQSIAISFTEWDGLKESKFIGLANYAELAHDPDFRTALANNVIWLVGYLLAIPLGLALA